MKIFIGLVLALLGSTQSSLAAEAQGDLRLSIRYTGGFVLTQVQETEPGVIEGVSNWGMAQDFVSARLTPADLVIRAGGRDNVLHIIHAGNVDIYRGYLHSQDLAEITSFLDTKKNRLRITGNIGTTKFTYESNLAKREFYLKWDNLEIAVKGVKNSPGECKGVLSADGSETGKLFCESSGNLDDAFFKRPEAVISFLIHPLILPDDNGGGGETGGSGE